MWLLTSIALEWFERNRPIFETEIIFKETPDDSVISQTDFWTLASLYVLKSCICVDTCCSQWRRGELRPMSNKGLPYSNDMDCDIGNTLTRPLGP